MYDERKSGTFRCCHSIRRTGAHRQSNAEILPATTSGTAIEIDLEQDPVMGYWPISWSSRREHEASCGGCPSSYIAGSYGRPQGLLGMAFQIFPLATADLMKARLANE